MPYGFAATATGVTTRALLDDPTYRPIAGNVLQGWVVGFGVGNTCGEWRAGGFMSFEGVGAWWRRGCRTVLNCDGSLRYDGAESTCALGGPNVGPLIRMARSGERTPPGSGATIWTGVYPTSGDSGGPLLVDMVPGPGRAREELVIGVYHGNPGGRSAGGGTCSDPIDERFHEALYAPTFGVPTGPFIELQLFAWLNVRVPAIRPFGP